MKCPSGKRSYDTEDLALEALIGAHINFHHREGGPLNYYQCNDCGAFHLTSRGPEHQELTSPETRKRIERERESRDWERRLR